MSVLYYFREDHPVGHRIRGVIETVVTLEQIEIYRSMDELSGRLCRAAGNIWAAILFGATAEDLYDFIGAASLLEDIRIILVLPDHETETVRGGLVLRPRFLTYIDSNPFEIGEVLSRMLSINPNIERSIEK